MKKMEQGSPGMDRAMKSLEQAKARYEEEKRNANAKRRKAENHHPKQSAPYQCRGH